MSAHVQDLHDRDAEAEAGGPDARAVLRRVSVEIGPLLVFFFSYWFMGILAATAFFMAVTVAVTVGSYWLSGRLPIVPIISTVIVLITGGLTLALQEEQFIKMRVTAVNGLYAAALLGSLIIGRPLLARVMDGTLSLSDRGWHGLTWRLGAFLLALAVVNEIVWRSFSTDTWVMFKVLGIVPLDLAFGAAMWPYVKSHAVSDGQAA